MKQDNIDVHKWSGDLEPDEAAMRKLLDEEGLHPYRWSNGPGDVYGTHSHAFHKVIYVVKGSITLPTDFDIFSPRLKRNPWP